VSTYFFAEPLSDNESRRLAEKSFRMLREPQHERKIINVETPSVRFFGKLRTGSEPGRRTPRGFFSNLLAGQTCFDKSHNCNSKRREK
jgi:hypothetical protein